MYTLNMATRAQQQFFATMLQAIMEQEQQQQQQQQRQQHDDYRDELDYLGDSFDLDYFSDDNKENTNNVALQQQDLYFVWKQCEATFRPSREDLLSDYVDPIVELHMTLPKTTTTTMSTTPTLATSSSSSSKNSIRRRNRFRHHHQRLAAAARQLAPCLSIECRDTQDGLELELERGGRGGAIVGGGGATKTSATTTTTTTTSSWKGHLTHRILPPLTARTNNANLGAARQPLFLLHKFARF